MAKLNVKERTVLFLRLDDAQRAAMEVQRLIKKQNLTHQADIEAMKLVEDINSGLDALRLKLNRAPSFKD